MSRFRFESNKISSKNFYISDKKKKNSNKNYNKI